jgi:hypothetical protein
MPTFNWNVASGEWATNGDWSLSGAPTGADTADISNGGTATVGSTDTTAVAGILNVSNGGVIVQGDMQVYGLAVTGSGSLTVDGGHLTYGATGLGALAVLAPALGTVKLESGGEYTFNDNTLGSVGNTIDFTGTGGTFVDNALWGGTIDNFNTSDSNSITFNSPIFFQAFNTVTNSLDVFTVLRPYSIAFGSNGLALTQSNFTINGDSIDYTGATTVCFASGTRIRTLRGDVPVENLQVGDLTLTASGDLRPIRWLGHRRVDCRRHPRAREILPIRVAAHAFAPNRPARDLYLSPAHAICVEIVGEALIPVSALHNGATIQQVDVNEVTYWHVELGSHDILLAENLPTESYLEAGNRAFFAESGLVQLGAVPEVEARASLIFCRPFHEAGALVEAVRLQLIVRARSLGWTLDQDRLADLHLVVDGRRVDPILQGRRARFNLSRGAQEVWLASATTRPVDVGRGADARMLGVCVASISVEAGSAPAREIPLDDPTLGVGFHAVERRGERNWRWTRGRALLPAALLGDRSDPFVLTVELGGDAPPRWVAAPEATKGEMAA